MLSLRNHRGDEGLQIELQEPGQAIEFGLPVDDHIPESSLDLGQGKRNHYEELVHLQEEELALVQHDVVTIQGHLHDFETFSRIH